MKFGIVLPLERAEEAKPAGFDFIEPDALPLLRPDLPDDQWAPPASTAIAVVAVSSIIPPTLPITGPDVDLSSLRLHIHRTCERAHAMGVRVLVLSSPRSLHVPVGFDAKQAKQQIIEFLRIAIPFFPRYELMLVAGVNATECNILTTLPEVLQYVWQIDHPHFQCLLDVHQVSTGAITLEQVNDALPWVRHVHVGGEDDSQGVFSLLKRAGYSDAITVTPTDDENLPGALQNVRQRWSAS